MIKKIMVLFSMVFVFAFSEIRDGINLFTESEKKKLDEVSKVLEEKYNLKIYIITSEYSDETMVDGPDKSVIVNLEREENKKIRIRESFSQDLNMAEKEEELNTLVDNLEHYLHEEKFVSYIEELLKNSLELYTEEEEKEEFKLETFLYHYKWQIIKWLVIVLTILNIVVRMKRISKEKKARASKKEVKK